MGDLGGASLPARYLQYQMQYFQQMQQAFGLKAQGPDQEFLMLMQAQAAQQAASFLKNRFIIKRDYENKNRENMMKKESWRRGESKKKSDCKRKRNVWMKKEGKKNYFVRRN